MTHSPNAIHGMREPSPKKLKSKPKVKQWHVANTKYGMGDNYGTGIKAPLGKVRGGYSPNTNPTPKAKLKKPPKSLA